MLKSSSYTALHPSATSQLLRCVGQVRDLDFVAVFGCGAIYEEVLRCGGSAKRYGLSVDASHDLANGCGFEPLFQMCMTIKKGGIMWVHVDSKSWLTIGNSGVSFLTVSISSNRSG